MRPLCLAAAVLLLVSPTATAQEAIDQQPFQGADASAEPPVRYAVPRPASAPATRAEAPSPPPTAAVAEDAGDQRRAVPRGTRPRGDNPPVGRAVPRGTERRPDPRPVDRGERARGRSDGGTVIVTRPPVYTSPYYYRRHYPYGYGAFGLGYFYYDPYRWYPRGYSVYRPGYSYRGGYTSSARFDIGELRLRVTPRHAEVFIDGYYAGLVDDFDGIFQSLKLESGPYRVEIVAPGFESLAFDIRISPGQKISYRGDLLRRP